MKKGPQHVLIVERDALQAYLLEVTLREAGWEVCIADDPKEALLCCERNFFDAAIINYKYPGNTNGFLLARLLQDQYNLPSLMITATRYTDLKRHPSFNVNQEFLFKPYRLLECGPRLQAVCVSGLSC